MFKKACRLFYVVCLPVTLLVEESCSLRPVLFVSQQLMHIVHLLRQRVLHAHTHTHTQLYRHTPATFSASVFVAYQLGEQSDVVPP